MDIFIPLKTDIAELSYLNKSSEDRKEYLLKLLETHFQKNFRSHLLLNSILDSIAKYESLDIIISYLTTSLDIMNLPDNNGNVQQKSSTEIEMFEILSYLKIKFEQIQHTTDKNTPLEKHIHLTSHDSERFAYLSQFLILPLSTFVFHANGYFIKPDHAVDMNAVFNNLAIFLPLLANLALSFCSHSIYLHSENQSEIIG